MTKYARRHPGRTKKPQPLVEDAGRLHLQGESNRDIARTLGIHQAIVPSLLDRSKLVEEFRLRLLDEVPRLLENFRILTTPSPSLPIVELGKNTRWGLEQTQIGVSREVREHELHDPLGALTDEEFAELRRRLDRIIRRAGAGRKDRGTRRAPLWDAASATE